MDSGPRAPALQESVRRVFEERAEALARPVARRDPRAAVEMLVLAVGDQRVALPAERAQEVLQPGRITKLAAGPLIGVRSVRGQIVALADLAQLLQIPSSVPIAERWVAVVDDPIAPLGLLVDAAVDLVSVPAGDLLHTGMDGRLLSGMTPDGVLVIDLDGLLTDRRLYIDSTSEPHP